MSDLLATKHKDIDIQIKHIEERRALAKQRGEPLGPVWLEKEGRRARWNGEWWA